MKKIIIIKYVALVGNKSKLDFVNNLYGVCKHYKNFISANLPHFYDSLFGQVNFVTLIATHPVFQNNRLFLLY